MSRIVSCPRGALSWARLLGALSERGISAQLRMIDGQLAFPDEEPAADWKEIRVAIAGSMVTLRRHAEGIELVTWGNADPNQQAAADRIADAIAALSGA